MQTSYSCLSGYASYLHDAWLPTVCCSESSAEEKLVTALVLEHLTVNELLTIQGPFKKPLT